jgi:hypothetical protein
VKYLTALQRFHKLFLDIFFDLQSLIEIQLTDVLVARRLSRVPKVFMPSVPMLIKAARWGDKIFAD